MLKGLDGFPAAIAEPCIHKLIGITTFGKREQHDLFMVAHEPTFKDAGNAKARPDQVDGTATFRTSIDVITEINDDKSIGRGACGYHRQDVIIADTSLHFLEQIGTSVDVPDREENLAFGGVLGDDLPVG